MKGFKKLALVTAIAAAPFAQAELTAIDDSVLSEMTGQAGVTIELDTAVTIGSLIYTDTDGNVVDSVDGPAGTIEMNTIAFGGAGVTSLANSFQDARFDDIKIDIDVDGTDGIIIHLIGTDTKNALLGINPADFGLKIGDVGSNALAGNLASGIEIAGNLGPIDITIDGDGTVGNDLITVEAYFEVTQGKLDVDVIGLGISNLKIGQDSSPLFAATSAYRAELEGVTEIAGTITGSLADTTTAGTLGTNLQGYLDSLTGVDAGFTVAGVEAGTDVLSDPTTYDDSREAGVTAIIGAVVDGAVLADDGSGSPTAANAEVFTATGGLLTNAQIETLALTNNASNFAFAKLAVGTADTSYYSLADNATISVTDALSVDIQSLNIDVSMDLALGKVGGFNQSIGSIAIQDLNLSGTKLVIYGH